MSAPDLIQRQRETLRALRRANRIRAEAEAAAHEEYKKTTETADAAFQSTRKNAENARNEALTAESQRQIAHRNASSALEAIRNRAQQQMDAIAAVMGNGRSAVWEAGLERLWPDDAKKIDPVESAQAEAELARRVQLAGQAEQELKRAINEWHEAELRATRRRRVALSAALVGILIVVWGFPVYQAPQRAQSTATARAEATATANANLPFPERMKAITGVEFVFVPDGEFIMGSPDGVGASGEHPQRPIHLDDFWIGRTEVTNTQWRAFVEAGGYNTQRFWTPDGWAWRRRNNITLPGCWYDSGFNASDQPVVCVSWYEAAAYTRWLSEKSGVIVRLPTEAEWEKAARGSDGRSYPWGNEQPNHRLLNYNDNVRRAAPVGSYPEGASPYGALDMAGNVWEWTADWYDETYYGRAPDRNPTGPETGRQRVVRGGAFYHNAHFVRCAVRNRHSPDLRRNFLGVRAVVLPPGF